jgi:hypothetical protein
MPVIDEAELDPDTIIRGFVYDMRGRLLREGPIETPAFIA